LLKPFAAEEILKAQVGTQGIEAGIHFEESHHPVTVVMGFFEPREGFFFFAQADINQRNMVRRDVTLPREFVQPFENLTRIIFPTRQRIGVT
jgi:hypothetical protein